jgi:protein TonB
MRGAPGWAISSVLAREAILRKYRRRLRTAEWIFLEGKSTLLRQAALQAVKSWRYRPYLLGGTPVEVETTVHVVFSMQ